MKKIILIICIFLMGHFLMAQESKLMFDNFKNKAVVWPSTDTSGYSLPLTLSFDGKKFINKQIQLFNSGHQRVSSDSLVMHAGKNKKFNYINHDSSGNFVIIIDTNSNLVINGAPTGEKINDSGFYVVADNDTVHKSSLIHIKTKVPPAPGTRTGNNETPELPFIDSAMINSISKTGACDSCLQSAVIKNRSERKFSTDYFITFDASRRLDDYTICKHIYKKNEANKPSDQRLIEKYRKVAPAWFAPHVGSQLKFQVINQPFADKSKIVVNDSDLFIDNASFQSVVSNQLASTLLSSARNAATTAKTADSTKQSDNKTQAGKTDTTESDSAKIKRLFTELSAYVNVLTLSPCTIATNRNNLVVIKSRIQSQFKTSVDVLNDLVKQFDTTNEKDIALSVKNIISGLDSLKPLVYSTPRLANRDFINIKVINGSNETIADENIRTSFGLKIDYSAGVFLTGLRDDNFIFIDTTIKNYKPDTLPARDTSGNFLRKQTPNNLNVGFGVLVHIYPRISSNYNIGITTGFMATTNLDLNILLGGSMMFQSLFGSNNRVVFNGGIAWGKVKRLSTAYQEGFHANQITTTNPTGIPVFYSTTGDPTVQVWRKSWFFGITYNFK